MKNYIYTAAILLVSTIVALLAGEMVLRQFYKYPQPQFLEIDFNVGHRHRPGVKGWFTREGSGYVSINSFGIRDNEYSVERLPHKKRMVVLGDSYTEALQVDIDQTFHGLLESEYENQLEVLNFGVSGFGTGQELLTYRNYVREFRPDIVALIFNPGNDLADNDIQLSNNYPRPYYKAGPEGLVLDNSFRKTSKYVRSRIIYSVYYALTDNSIVLSLLDQLRYSVGLTPTALSRQDREPEGSNSDLLYGATSDKHLDVWKLTELLILEMSEDVRADGGVFVLFTQDSMPTQYTTLNNSYYVEERLGAFCKKQNMICGFMAKRAIEHYKNTGMPLHGFDGRNSGHWNHVGHQIAYQVLRDTLLKAKLIQ